jgi:2-amino-4-hydroxy-6-hydroxymethyldihydropteridine diphosphokinase
MCQVAEIRLCGAIYQAAIPERNMFDVHFREGRMKLARSTHALVALGGNLPLGDDRPDAVLRAAFDSLTTEGMRVVSVSRIYRTPAFPAGTGPDYANAAALVEVDALVDPEAVLAALHRIEAAFGRVRGQRWAGRVLDLDLLAIGETILPDPGTQRQWQSLPPQDQAQLAPDRLILPHPRLQDRAFVLVPLADVAPDWRHPLSGLSVDQMLQALPAEDVAAVVPWV